MISLDGFVPRDALELALAALAHATHGVFQTLGAVHASGMGEALGANTVITALFGDVACGGAHDLAVANVDVQVAALDALGAACAGENLLLAGLGCIGGRLEAFVSGRASGQSAGGAEQPPRP